MKWLLLLLLLLFVGCGTDSKILKGHLTEVRHDSTNMKFITLKFEGGATVDVHNDHSIPLYVGHYQEIEIGKCYDNSHTEYMILNNVSPGYEVFLATKRREKLKELAGESEAKLANK
jgi:hypothetical protein